MKVVQFADKIEHGELRIKPKIPYVLADPIANQLASVYRGKLQKLEIFEPHYRPYLGQNLNNKKICIWRTGGFGDILFITPIVEYLKRKYTNCKISVATSERFKDVWKNNPHIDKFTSSFTLPLRLDFITRHDYAGIFEGTIENFKDKKQYCAIDNFAFNLGIFDMPLELKRPRYYLTDAEVNVAKNRVKAYCEFEIHKEPYACFQWKSSSKLRDYPYEKLIMSMYKIQKETGYKVVILTHPNYKRIIDHEIRVIMEHTVGDPGGLDYINLAGVTSYRESAAVLALSTGLVGIDSSLTHLAAALGVPSVTVYGPFSGEWRTAYNKNNISLQKPEVCCNAPCAFHTQPGQPDGLPMDLCTDKGRLPQYSQEKFCRVMSAVTSDEILESYMTLLNLQRNNNLPTKREFVCKI